MTNRLNILLILLEKELSILNKTHENLKFTYNNCIELDLYVALDPESEQLLDSLASRFIRHFEASVKQVLRTSLRILGEYENSFLDNSNKAAKLEFVSSSDFLSTFRDFRNIIAHEYLEEEWIKMYADLLQFIPTALQETNSILLKSTSLLTKLSSY